MTVIVDTNVIFDVLHADPNWLSWSKARLTEFDSQLMINPFIYSELCYAANSRGEVDVIVRGFGFDFEELPREALFLAAQAYRRYRQIGGQRTAPLPDFFIGAHAAAIQAPILTRDSGRYKTYFPQVPLILPP